MQPVTQETGAAVLEAETMRSTRSRAGGPECGPYKVGSGQRGSPRGGREAGGSQILHLPANGHSCVQKP